MNSTKSISTKAIIALATLALLAVNPALAYIYTGSTFQIEVSNAETVSEGGTLSVTVTITNLGSQTINSVSGAIASSDSTTWLSGTSTQSFGNLAASGSTSKTYSLTATSSGSHTFIVKASGTSVGSESTESQTVTVQSAPTFSYSITPSSASASSTATVSATISNTGTATASSGTATLSLGTCTLNSGSTAAVSTGDISGASSRTVSWDIDVPSSSGTCTASVSFGYTYNSESKTSTSQTQSITISCGTTTTTTTTTGGGGGGGGGDGASNVATSVKNALTATAAGAKQTITIAPIAVDKVGVSEIQLTAENAIPAGANLTVAKLKAKPSAIAQDPVSTGKIYSYIEITPAGFATTDVKEATLKFQVTKAWLTENGVTQDKVALYRYASDKWSELTTTVLNSDDTNVYLSAVSPGFSTFAIGEKTPAVTPATTAETTEETTPSGQSQSTAISGDVIAVIPTEDTTGSDATGAATTPSTAIAPSAATDCTFTLGVAAVVAIVILAVVFLRRRTDVSRRL